MFSIAVSFCGEQTSLGSWGFTGGDIQPGQSPPPPRPSPARGEGISLNIQTAKRLLPLAVQIEGSGGSPAQPEVELLENPPLPRVWFLEPNGNKLIQVQRERFHHNWRKINPGDEYPAAQARLQIVPRAARELLWFSRRAPAPASCD